MTAAPGQRVALVDVAVRATLDDLRAEVAMTQTYRNDEAVGIEAVYTFPLPLDAVLLELEVEIGGRRLAGVVVEKRFAEARYEDAIDRGDAAVMLQNPEPGLYTMNVGNLLAGETAKVGVRYAQLHRWTGDRLRFFLPTTIAPRYGESLLAPHQAPEPSLTVENRFSLSLEIAGALAEAQFECPTHAVELRTGADGTRIVLEQPRAVMDRDFVLSVRAPNAPRSAAVAGADGEGSAVIACFRPLLPGLHKPAARNVAVVVDCSGSMAGTSIAQAKQALDRILGGLLPEDRLALVAFGSHCRSFGDSLQRCDAGTVGRARAYAAALDADMGGTEIGAALRQVYAIAGQRRVDLFLITDGEVSDWQPVVDEAARRGHRVFSVGVGSAVSEAFLRTLSERTGGSCELVTPAEDMAGRVVRHFERMRAPRAECVAVRWPDGALDVTPSAIGCVYAGDTVFASARFDGHRTGGEVALEVELGDGRVMRTAAVIPASSGPVDANGCSTTARLAAANRLGSLAEAAARATAVRYRLVSPHTHWLVVAERAAGERALDLPELRKVPQTLAAGWGGVGVQDEAAMTLSAFFCNLSPARNLAARNQIRRPASAAPDISPEPFGSVSFFDAFMGDSDPPPPAAPAATSEPAVPFSIDRIVAALEDIGPRFSADDAPGILARHGLAALPEVLGIDGARLREAWVATLLLHGLGTAFAHALTPKALAGLRVVEPVAAGLRARLDDLLRDADALTGSLREVVRQRGFVRAVQLGVQRALEPVEAWRAALAAIDDAAQQAARRSAIEPVA